MNALDNYFNETELFQILTLDPDLANLEAAEIEDFIAYLQNIGCEEETIRESIYQNPHALENTVRELHKLTTYLRTKEIENFDELFYHNPFIMSCSREEMEAIFDEHIQFGLTEKDVISKLLEGEQL